MERNGLVTFLKQELARLEQERRSFDAKVNTIKELIRLYDQNGPSSVAVPRLKKLAKMKQADATYLILKEQKIPLHVRDITRVLVERGMRFKTRKPELSVVSALLRDTDRVVNIGKNTFALREWEEKESAPESE